MGKRSLEARVADLEEQLRNVLLRPQYTVPQVLTDRQIYRGAEIIVAAYNSPAWKGQIHFVCDGKDDDVTIQQALDAVPDTGGTVTLLEGDYELGTSKTSYGTYHFLNPKSKTWFRGQGRGTVIRTAAPTVTFFEGAMVKIDGVTDVVVSDMVLDSYLNGSGQDSWQVSIGHAVASQRVQLERLECLGGATRPCIDISVGVSSGVADVVISQCAIHDNPGNSHIRIFNTVTGVCRIENCHSYGINGLYSINTWSARTLIVGNWIESNGYFDMSAEGCIIANNFFFGNTESGEGATNAVMIGNVWKGGSAGSSIYTGEEAVFVGNTLEDRFGISAGPDTAVTGNAVARTTGTVAGITMSDRSLIVGNVINASGGHGIHATSTRDDCIINNNRIYRAGRAADLTYDGIFIEGDRNMVNGNQIRGETVTSPRSRYGINIASTADRTMATNNDLYTSGASGSLNNAGTNTQTASANRL